MYNYGEALKYQREIMGISQVELAKKINTSHQNINRWERGEVLPNIDFCVQLADFYGITLDELIGRDNGTRTKISNSFNNFNNTGNISIK
jgi:ribosome-binding protein aMBF1 (putative translation factor)